MVVMLAAAEDNVLVICGSDKNDDATVGSFRLVVNGFWVTVVSVARRIF